MSRGGTEIFQQQFDPKQNLVINWNYWDHIHEKVNIQSLKSALSDVYLFKYFILFIYLFYYLYIIIIIITIIFNQLVDLSVPLTVCVKVQFIKNIINLLS